MEKKYYPTIGLEIHAELKTQTKMFCGCKNDPDEEKSNVNICPVCMAHPGTLPVANKKAIENVIKVGLALGSKIADFTEFDRKNYFYPDIPKGYQISQYKYPIVSGVHLADFEITRVHLEEDTANNKHDRGDFSLIDFNRAGIPLMELVTEPHVFKTDEEAAKATSTFAKELQLILWYLGVSEANMEKGEMRVEANISVSEDKNKLGTKVEVKNLNSFKSVEKAIKYEIDRMIELLENGKGSEIVQETRGWDESKQKTFSQRKKESSHDYRYFPEPDLPKMKLHEAFDLGKMEKELPELPEQKRFKYKSFGIKNDACEIFINDKEFGDWFEKEVIPNFDNKEEITIAANFAVNDIQGYIQTRLLEGTTRLPNALKFSKIVKMYKKGEITSRGAKDMLGHFATNIDFFNEEPEEFAKIEGMIQQNDEGAVKTIVEKIISENSEVVATYKAGKEVALMSLVGQIMKETKGSANPSVAKQLLIDLLK
ncbi:MAG: Asp-tRNA(Asn)/Glu-tRNA(Gln) amidotransferase subunit GatB [Candidatus Paceibacterota bacterium]|jgi:aspartyl-tRNA(Asn)/glutamyl-tRNA(Gln) amidotransferase subunit B